MHTVLKTETKAKTIERLKKNKSAYMYNWCMGLYGNITSLSYNLPKIVIRSRLFTKKIRDRPLGGRSFTTHSTIFIVDVAIFVQLGTARPKTPNNYTQK